MTEAVVVTSKESIVGSWTAMVFGVSGCVPGKLPVCFGVWLLPILLQATSQLS